MIHPSDPELTDRGLRDGRDAPVTCAACGCRLAATGEAWFHFNPISGRDARGCRIACADAAHDATGRPIALAVWTPAAADPARSVAPLSRAVVLVHDQPIAHAPDGHDCGPPASSTLARRRARCGLSQSRSGSVSAGQPARASWRCGTMSPLARTSASSSRNSVGVRVSDGIPEARLVAARLQGQVAGGQRPAAGRARHAGAIDPAHDRGDPGQQLGLAERLGQVVVRPEPSARTLAASPLSPDTMRIGAWPTARIWPATENPSGPGHRQVQQDEVRVLLAEALDRGQPVVGGDDLVALGPDERGDGADHGRVVIHDEDPQGAGAHGAHILSLSVSALRSRPRRAGRRRIARRAAGPARTTGGRPWISPSRLAAYRPIPDPRAVWVSRRA